MEDSNKNALLELVNGPMRAGTLHQRQMETLLRHFQLGGSRSKTAPILAVLVAAFALSRSTRAGSISSSRTTRRLRCANRRRRSRPSKKPRSH